MQNRSATRPLRPLCLCTALGSLLATACTGSPAVSVRDASILPPAQYATPENPFEPIPSDLDLDGQCVELGRALFFDRRVSGDGSRSCSDCHDLAAGGMVVGESRSNHPDRFEAANGPYNVPTVFNVGLNAHLNWRGEVDDLETQLDGPMMKGMKVGSWDDLIARLAPDYSATFRDAGYPDGVTETAIREVFAEFQRSLVTPNGRFDRFLRGEIELSAQEGRGYALFKSVGCVSCHQGTNVGGNLYQRFGVFEDAFDGVALVEHDYGRSVFTGLAEDEFVFRVPSLRNVQATAPYFHDGSAATLEAAVRKMAQVQLGYALDDDEVADIVAFLNTLTGEWDGAGIVARGPS